LPYLYDLSCIIITFNSAEFIEDCIQSIFRQNSCNFELIIVDNNSRDTTVKKSKEILRSNGIIEAQLIQNDGNLGFGKAVNLAATLTQGEYLFMLNPDTILSDNIFSEIIKFAQMSPSAGLVSPLLISPDGIEQLSARRLPSRMDLLRGRGSPIFKLGFSSEADAGYIEPAGVTPMAVPAVSATAALIPSKVFRTLGGFDDRFFMYMEDIDLCHRITDSGYKIWILPALKVIHQWRKSSSTRPYFACYHQYKSIHRYFVKYDPSSRLQNIFYFLILFIGFILTSILLFFRRRHK
jgi:GT2 family glycosyltransferase